MKKCVSWLGALPLVAFLVMGHCGGAREVGLILLPALVQQTFLCWLKPNIGRTIALAGLTCNTLVICANRGFMPVLYKSFAETGVWKHASATDRLLFLCDRFGGFSLGDFLLLCGALFALGEWAGRRIGVRA